MDGPADCMRKCLKCFLDCHIRFVKYTNINAYCQIALSGEDFCKAAIFGQLLIC
jgi:hypothetical protein